MPPSRQLQIEKGGVNTPAGKQLQRGHPVAGLEAIVHAFDPPEKALDGFAHQRVIIHNQTAHASLYSGDFVPASKKFVPTARTAARMTLRAVQQRRSATQASRRRTSSGQRAIQWAVLGRDGPTETEVPLGMARKAASSVVSSPR